MLRKIILQAVLCTAILFGVVSATEAAFTVSVTISGKGGGTTIITDGGKGDLDGIVNGEILASITSVKGYRVGLTVDSNSSSASSPAQIEDAVSVTRARGDATSRTVTVVASDNAFTFPSAGSAITIDNSLAFTPTAGTPATFSGKTMADGTPTTTLTSSGTSPTISKNLSSNPYTISNIVTGSGFLANGLSNGVTGTGSVAAVVPAPAALALIASGIPCALVYLRRRRKTA